MTSLFKGSPYRRRHDLEAGSRRSPYSDDQDHGMSSSPFYIIRRKDASIERLRRWRISPTAIFLILLLILVLFATAATCAAPAAAPSVASSTSSSVEFSEKSVSKHEEDNRKRDIAIDGNCTDVKCCGDLCKRQIQYAKTVNVAYRFINGKHWCFCSVICNNKPGACAP